MFTKNDAGDSSHLGAVEEKFSSFSTVPADTVYIGKSIEGAGRFFAR